MSTCLSGGPAAAGPSDGRLAGDLLSGRQFPPPPSRASAAGRRCLLCNLKDQHRKDLGHHRVTAEPLQGHGQAIAEPLPSHCRVTATAESHDRMCIAFRLSELCVCARADGCPSQPPTSSRPGHGRRC